VNPSGPASPKARSTAGHGPPISSVVTSTDKNGTPEQPPVLGDLLTSTADAIGTGADAGATNAAVAFPLGTDGHRDQPVAVGAHNPAVGEVWPPIGVDA
jgi:hypothetical protein